MQTNCQRKGFFDKLKEWEILIDVNKNTLENKQ